MKPLTDLANMYGDEAIDWIVENQYNYTLVENEKLSNSDCPDCEKVAKEKAAGIESYLASPLEIRNQYFLEKGEDAEGQIVLLDGQTVFYYKKGFVEWLLKKLVEAYAAR
jgi:hypothetical protein